MWLRPALEHLLQRVRVGHSSVKELTKIGKPPKARPPTSLRPLRRRGGAVGAFSDTRNTCLFIGGQKYWLNTHWDTDNLDDGNNCIPNWVRLNRDWRDFVGSRSNTGERQDQPEESVSLGRCAEWSLQPRRESD